MEIPIINNQFLLEKRISESGFVMNNWTYVVIHGIRAHTKSQIGTVKVRGFIDTYELKQCNLLPMKNDCLMLPINATVRKKLKKKEGDYVQVVLFLDQSPIAIPEFILASIADSQAAFKFFMNLSDSNQKYYIDWIEQATKNETKTERIIKTIERLEKKQKFYDWPERQ